MTNETQTTATAEQGSAIKFRANSDCHTAWNHQGVMVTTWRDGRKQEFNPKRAAMENRSHAEQHGWEQRMADSGAIEFEKISDKTARTNAKFDARQRLIDHYESGSESWNIKATARATGPDVGLVIQALIALGKVADVDAANAMFDKVAVKREITRDAVVGLFWAAKDVATKIAEIKAAGRAYAVSADDLLADAE
jgi:hypothetical protein